MNVLYCTVTSWNVMLRCVIFCCMIYHVLSCMYGCINCTYYSVCMLYVCNVDGWMDECLYRPKMV